MLSQTDLDRATLAWPSEGRNRRLKFSGTKNFRDLGGYRCIDGRSVRWGRLYRSGHLARLTDADLEILASLNLDRIIDLRAAQEKEEEPDRLPSSGDMRRVEIPLLDSSTRTWRETRAKFLRDNFRSIDPVESMKQTNIELATHFTPQMRRFIQELISAGGRPVLFHCTAGKDRTGFAAALLLRLLGVPPQTVMEDYLLSNRYYYPSFHGYLFALRLFKGRQFAAGVQGFLEVQPGYLSAGFEAITRRFGSFESYVRDGLGLSTLETELLKNSYLE